MNGSQCMSGKIMPHIAHVAILNFVEVALWSNFQNVSTYYQDMVLLTYDDGRGKSQVELKKKNTPV